MNYISTRGDAPELGFEDVLLQGLAPDGGLYVPGNWPRFDAAEIASWQGLSYADLAVRVMAPFLGDKIPSDDLGAMVERAYNSFSHDAITPLVEMDGNMRLLELFHGPTLSFKDVAMQLLGQLFDHVLQKRGQRVTVVGATSGDTGAAAVEALRGKEAVDVVILHPFGRITDIQRRQMTTAPDANVFNIALEGTFDDCQSLVKAMFREKAFRDSINMSAVNSINWARIMAQAVYYFHAGVVLGAPDRKIAFSVPTGNFGDIFAGYVAGKMGLPVSRLVIATNVNDILARAYETGRYEVRRVEPTISPAMDIQVASNFERLLFDAYGRDSKSVSKLMTALVESGKFEISNEALEFIRGRFDVVRVDEGRTKDEMARTLASTGIFIDPHTAVGVAASRAVKTEPDEAMICLSTAHPAKFPEAVEEATGQHVPLPPRLRDLEQRPERFIRLANDPDLVKDRIRRHSRSYGRRGHV